MTLLLLLLLTRPISGVDRANSLIVWSKQFCNACWALTSGNKLCHIALACYLGAVHILCQPHLGVSRPPSIHMGWETPSSTKRSWIHAMDSSCNRNLNMTSTHFLKPKCPYIMSWIYILWLYLALLLKTNSSKPGHQHLAKCLPLLLHTH